MTTAAESREGPVGRIFRWWLGEMTSMMPSFATRASVPRVARIEDGALVVRALRKDSAEPVATIPLLDEPDTAQSAGRARPVLLRLDASRAIVRTLTLPRAAEAHLANALRLQAELETPYRADDCLIGARVTGRGSGTITVDMAVVPTERATDLIERLSAAGFSVRRIEVDGAERPIAVDAGALTGAGGRDWLSAGLILLCLVLAAAAIWLPWQRLEERITDMDRTLAQLREPALRAEAAMTELDRLNARRALFAALGDDPRAVEIVDTIAQALPDSAWLQDLTIKDGEIRLVGFAPDAASIPAILAAEPSLTDVAFRAPVTLAPGEAVERFDLGLAYRVEP